MLIVNNTQVQVPELVFEPFLESNCEKYENKYVVVRYTDFTIFGYFCKPAQEYFYGFGIRQILTDSVYGLNTLEEIAIDNTGFLEMVDKKRAERD